MNVQTGNSIPRIAKVAAMSAGLLFAAGSQAHVAELYYDAFGGFLEGTEQGRDIYDGTPGDVDAVNFTDQEARDPNFPNAYRTVSWGIDQGGEPADPQSSLTLIGYDTDTSSDPDNFYSVHTESGILVPFGALLHQNNTVFGTALAGVDLSWNLHLYESKEAATANGVGVGNEPVHTVNLVFSLDVWETVNAEGVIGPFDFGTCANKEAAGTVVGTGVNGTQFISDGANTNVCDDAFAYKLKSGNLEEVFDLHGESYKLLLSGFWTEEGNGNLTPTFWSSEGGVNTGYVRFELVSVTVPVVGPLVLMMLGLGVLGLTVRQRGRMS